MTIMTKMAPFSQIESSMSCSLSNFWVFVTWHVVNPQWGILIPFSVLPAWLFLELSSFWQLRFAAYFPFLTVSVPSIFPWDVLISICFQSISMNATLNFQQTRIFSPIFLPFSILVCGNFWSIIFFPSIYLLCPVLFMWFLPYFRFLFLITMSLLLSW